MKKNLIALIVFMFLILPSFAIEEVGQTLYLSDCISIALKNSPIIKKAILNYQAAKKDVNIAKAQYSPTFGFGVNYWQGFNTDPNYDDGYTKRYLPTVGLYLSQLIYDFGKTSAKINMQKFFMLAAKYNFIESICETVNNVKLNYFAVLEAKSAVDIEENNYNINKKILDETKALVDKKQKQQIDYINAQFNFSNAEMRLVEAENTYNQALIGLSNAMYINSDADYEIVNIDTFDYYEAYFSPAFIEAPKGRWHELKNRERQKGLLGEVQPLSFTLAEAQDAASKNNPEILTLDSVLEAMKSSLLLTKRQFYPEIRARVGYEYDTKYVSNIDHTYTNNQLNVGVGVSSSLNPFSFSNEYTKAKIQVEIAENDIFKLKEDIKFSVKRCYLNVETAQKQIENAKNKVLYSKKNFEAAKDDYLSGYIGYIALQSARQNYNQAKIDYIKELRNYNSALAELERTTHIHEGGFHDIAHKMLIEDKKK